MYYETNILGLLIYDLTIYSDLFAKFSINKYEQIWENNILTLYNIIIFQIISHILTLK